MAPRRAKWNNPSFEPKAHHHACLGRSAPYLRHSLRRFLHPSQKGMAAQAKKDKLAKKNASQSKPKDKEEDSKNEEKRKQNGKNNAKDKSDPKSSDKKASPNKPKSGDDKSGSDKKPRGLQPKTCLAKKRQVARK